MALRSIVLALALASAVRSSFVCSQIIVLEWGFVGGVSVFGFSPDF
jgi:hypothetical protein